MNTSDLISKVYRGIQREEMIMQCEENSDSVVEELKNISLDGEEFWHPSSLEKLKTAALHQTFRVVEKEVQ